MEHFDDNSMRMVRMPGALAPGAVKLEATLNERPYIQKIF